MPRQQCRIEHVTVNYNCRQKDSRWLDCIRHVAECIRDGVISKKQAPVELQKAAEKTGHTSGISLYYKSKRIHSFLEIKKEFDIIWSSNSTPKTIAGSLREFLRTGARIPSCTVTMWKPNHSLYCDSQQFLSKLKRSLCCKTYNTRVLPKLDTSAQRIVKYMQEKLQQV